MSDTTRRPGPGLAKTHGLSLVATRETRLARANDAPWRTLFEAADAVSEGGTRDEPGGRVWYGSTSLILRMPGMPARERAFAMLVGERDVHVRLRALRMAHREAVARAPAPLGMSTCEMRFALDPGGVRIDVDVQAPLIERRAGTHAPSGGPK
jgi:hypothetical protein